MLIFLLLIPCVILFHLATRFSRRGRLVDKIPGDRAYPLVGNLLRFTLTSPHDLWNEVRTVTAKYYPITRIWFVKSALISVRHPDDVQVLLTNQKAIDKGYIYDYLRPWLKNGLLTSTGKNWQIRRKLLTPAFHFNILKKYQEIINEKGEAAVAGLRARSDAQTLSVTPFCSMVALNVITEAAMGVSLRDMKDENLNIERYKEAVENYGEAVIYRVPRPYVFEWLLKLPWKIGNLQRKALRVLDEFSDEIIRKRKIFHESSDNRYLEDLTTLDHDEDTGDDVAKLKKLSMLDLLLVAERNGAISVDGIKEEVDTFVFEGHDTVGMAMTFALMLLAENQEAQKKARTEVTRLLDRKRDKLEPQDLQQLEYLNRCVKESLRLFPPVATILRRTPDDLQLKNALVPAGSHIVVHLFDLHRDPRFWPDPKKFEPDRFLPENSKGRHPFAYAPFSAGPRNCIGQKFAMMELKSTIARILHDFYLEPVTPSSSVKLTTDIILRTVEPVYVRLRRISETTRL